MKPSSNPSSTKKKFFLLYKKKQGIYPYCSGFTRNAKGVLYIEGNDKYHHESIKLSRTYTNWKESISTQNHQTTKTVVDRKKGTKVIQHKTTK
jgi:hypothetical protein